ncbi:glycosyltransferase [Acidiphilium sp.]|uniref:glycosyltransferase n=1 Tax=Acidiphilium sp. TaxID=527 RepID=UPI003CFBFF3F
MKPQLLVDARCLQLPDFARRGIGAHLATMLASPLSRAFHVTLLFDPALPMPDPDLAALGDAATTTAYAASRSDAVFLQPAPFAAPPGRIARLLRAPECRSVAVVHDFIPLDLPQVYLTTQSARRTYAAGLAALRRYRHFLPVSHATARRLRAAIPHGAGHCDVTGVAVRAGLACPAQTPPPGFGARSGIVVVAGDDPRKNPEIVLAAALGTAITFVGIHDPAAQARLSDLHHRYGGAGAALRFMPRMSDAALAALYAGARLMIAPSRAEGFSMPIIEAMAQATPVLAADEPAQAERIAAEDRFAPDDAAALRHKAMRLLTDPLAWQAAQSRQSGSWRDFTEAAVAARFWAPITAMPAHPGLASPAVRRGAAPRLAVLTPLPPTPSGCADHSAALLAALADHACVTVFSDTAAPIVPPGVNFGGRAEAGVMRAPRFDAIVAVLGNSPVHATETRLLLDYGAAAILHDARLSGLYRAGFGAARALGVAAAELGRDVTQAELDAWEREQIHMPARFLGEIAAAATPLIVHARETAAFLAARSGIVARMVPFAPYRVLDESQLTPAARAAARARLGIAEDAALIASFGHVHPGKDPETLIAAFGLIAATRRCRFALLGSGNPTLVASLRASAESRGIAPADLMLGPAVIPESIYRDYLAAADVAVQLRRAPPGSISGALADAIAAGLPCVAAATLVAALDPPAYVTPVADDAEPAAIAAAIGAALDGDRAAIPALRADFMTQRSMSRYAQAVLQAVIS